jgi:hypothetical protein
MIERLMEEENLFAGKRGKHEKDYHNAHNRCSFCRKHRRLVRKLIKVPNSTFVCDRCAEICSMVPSQEVSQSAKNVMAKKVNLRKIFPTPKGICFV